MTIAKPMIYTMKNFVVLVLFVASALIASSASAVTEEDATNVSLNKGQLVSVHNSDGSVCSSPFGGYTSSVNQFFDGKKDDSASIEHGGDGNYTPRLPAGGYFDIDFSSVMPGGWYITKIAVYQVISVSYKYSLYVSMDGANWTRVEDAVGVFGTKSYTVSTTATHVKFVFEENSAWNGNIAEIEVYGLNPDEMECLHPEKYLTQWEAIPGTANCTDYGIDQRQCTNCWTYLQRQSTSVLPLGHIYETVLVTRGTSLAYGTGTNVCSRCGNEIAFPEPVDLTCLGGIAVPGIIQFTDISVSSTGDPDWGVNPSKLIDGNWGRNFQPITFWYAATVAVSEYVQFAFNTTIDLAWIELSAPNREFPYKLQFYSVEGGIETLVGEQAVEYDSESGDYQRLTIEFRGVSLSALRIKSNDASNKLEFGELHPWGTVAGAGKSAAVRTRVIIE